jgi:hypothetical protein
MVMFLEGIKRMMGWCPNVTPARYRSMQPVDFEYTSQTPSGRSNVENVQSNNVMFSANTTLFNLCFVFCLNMVLFLAQKIDYTILIPIFVAMYSLFYFIVTKIFHANVSIDENGVHLKSFEFKDITLDYKDIRSVTPNKLIKPSVVLIAMMMLILAVLLVYSFVYGEWKVIITLSPLLLGYLFFTYKIKRKYHDLDTQLYIQAENKNRYVRWYEITSYHSIVTDEMTASRIQVAIKHYMEAQ